MKKAALTALAVGIFLLLLGIYMPIAYFQCRANDGTIDIIGGADGPMYSFFFFHLFNGLPFVLVLFGTALVVTALVCLLFHNSVRKYCRLQTSAISLALSAVGGLGLSCFFLWFSIAAFGEASKYPILYPASVVVGLTSFGVFVALIWAYIRHRYQKWSYRGLIIDVLTSVLYLPAFFFLFSLIFDWL